MSVTKFSTMKILGIIPARAGSQRIPGKNWRELNGQPLARYAMTALAAAKSPTDIVVTTDSEEVLALARLHSNFHCILRPAALSTATAPAITYVKHAMEHMAALGKTNYDAIVIVQPTSPFTLAEDIDATVALLSDPAADSAASIMEIPHDLNPLKFKTLEPNGLLSPYYEAEAGRMATHQLPRIYVRNGSVYVARATTITAGKIIGDKCLGYLMPRERSLDLNDEFDWKMAEFMLHQKGAI